MIYLGLNNGGAMLIIEPGNIDRLKAGKPLVSPDRKFAVVYTPDIDWTMEQISAMTAVTDNHIDPDLINFIIAEGLKREEVKR